MRKRVSWFAILTRKQCTRVFPRVVMSDSAERNVGVRERNEAKLPKTKMTRRDVQLFSWRSTDDYYRCLVYFLGNSKGGHKDEKEHLHI